MIQTDSSVSTQILQVEGHRARHSNGVALHQRFLFGTIQVHIAQAIHIDRIL